MTTETSRPGCVIDDERRRMIDEMFSRLPVYEFDVSALRATSPETIVMVRTELPDGTIIEEPLADAYARQKAQRDTR